MGKRFNGIRYRKRGPVTERDPFALEDTGGPFQAQDLNLAVFEGEDVNRVLWQPRIDYWYEANRQQGTLPQVLAGASLLEAYDYCQASVRYFTKPLHKRYERVQLREVWENERRLRITWQSPRGELTELRQYDAFKLSWHTLEHQLEKPEDFDVLESILEDETWYWDQEEYEADLARVGGRGCPQFFFRRSPIQGLFIDRMGYEPAIHALYDHPDLIERYLRMASAADDAMYDVLCRCPAPILNLGENIDACLNPPPIWREHLIPYYRKRIDQLHDAGKFVHLHVDGAMSALLPHLRDCPWDGIEAATPQPQGDVSLLEIKEVVGERVLLDGIPAVYFLPDLYSVEELLTCTRNVVELFHPRLVLGISDELPSDADIERVRAVGELVADTAAASAERRR